MQRHFLTYQLALGFDRALCALEAQAPDREELLRLSRQSLHYFHRAIHASDAIERARFYVVTLTYLRDCKEMLDRLNVSAFDIRGRYEVLHARLEQICWDESKAEGGQLRMFG